MVQMIAGVDVLAGGGRIGELVAHSTGRGFDCAHGDHGASSKNSKWQ